MKRVKLIWDFRGPNATKIAEHHDIHLKEYIKKNDLKNSFSDAEEFSEMYSIAFLVVNESDMKSTRDTLRPHRGILHKD
jgi:hypothetical protein|tara:strand:- start:97 stop:333 length:237 start_codon:yes stop_codon:yes gene_type:complete